MRKLKHVVGAGSAKLIDVLVVIAHSNHTYIVIDSHQRPDKRILLFVHVLRLINDQHRLADPVHLHFTADNHLGGLRHHVLHLLQTAVAPYEVEAIGMEGLDVHIIDGITYQFYQAAFKFCGCRPGKSEHQELLMLHILKQQERSQLAYQHKCLAAAGTCGHHDTLGDIVGDDFVLAVGKAVEQLMIMRRRDVARYLFGPVALEIFPHKQLVVHLEIVTHIPQGRLIVAHHQIGILSHDMHLLDFLLVELIKHAIILFLELQAPVFFPPYLHGLIEHKETTLYLERAYHREIEQCLLDIFQLQRRRIKEKRFHTHLGFFQQLHHRERHGIVACHPLGHLRR